VLGSAGSTDQCHAASLRRPHSERGRRKGGLDPARTGRESPSDRQKGGSYYSRSAAA
jgi:hypothetical protein